MSQMEWLDIPPTGLSSGSTFQSAFKPLPSMPGEQPPPPTDSPVEAPYLNKKKALDARRIFACESPDCRKAYVSLSNLQSHQRRHLPKPLSCRHTPCSMTFPSEEERASHEKSHGDERFIADLVCFICGFSTMKRSNMKRHFTRGHKDFDLMEGLAAILKGTSQEDVGERGMPDEAGPFFCSICNFCTIGENNVQKHVWKIHKNHDAGQIISEIINGTGLGEVERKDPLVCYICSCSTTKSCDMWSHVQSNHPSVEICKAFTRILNGQNLAKARTGSTPTYYLYKYPTMAADPTQKHINERHEHQDPQNIIDKVMSGTDPEVGFSGGSTVKEPKLMCYLCSFSTVLTVNMKRHITRSHKDVVKNDVIDLTVNDMGVGEARREVEMLVETNRIICDICGLPFKGKHKPFNHIKRKHQDQNTTEPIAGVVSNLNKRVISAGLGEMEPGEKEWMESLQGDPLVGIFGTPLPGTRIRRHALRDNRTTLRRM